MIPLGRIRINWLLFVASAVFVVTTVSIGYARYIFGSVDSVLDYVQGGRIIVRERVKSLGEIPVKKDLVLEYSIANYTGMPVKIVGASFSCGCTEVSDLPMVLANGKTTSVNVHLDTSTGLITSNGPKAFSGKVLLLTDFKDESIIMLGYVGSINSL